MEAPISEPWNARSSGHHLQNFLLLTHLAVFHSYLSQKMSTIILKHMSPHHKAVITFQRAGRRSSTSNTCQEAGFDGLRLLVLYQCTWHHFLATMLSHTYTDDPSNFRSRPLVPILDPSQRLSLLRAVFSELPNGHALRQE